MKVAFFGLSILVGVLMLGGCAVPRAVGMDIMMRREVPVVAGGRRAKLEVYSSVQATSPTGITDIDSPLSVEETQKWYEDWLASRGWKPYTDHVCQDGTKGKDFSRSSGFHCGEQFVDLVYEGASIEVRPRPGGAGAIATISIWGDYIWDKPSRLPYLPFYWTLGESKASETVAQLLSWL